MRIAEPIIHSEKNVFDLNYFILVRDNKSNECLELGEKYSMRHFSIPEMELLAKITNF